jgi:hypothetical protein
MSTHSIPNFLLGSPIHWILRPQDKASLADVSLPWTAAWDNNGSSPNPTNGPHQVCLAFGLQSLDSTNITSAPQDRTHRSGTHRPGEKNTWDRQCCRSGSGSVGPVCFYNYVFGPPGSGSVNQRYGSVSGSFFYQEKIVRKT